jgi:omega-amidase
VNDSLRIAIAQPTMYWTTEENTERIVSSLQTSWSHGAQICVFPELAVTGFHRQIKTEATPEIVSNALARLQGLCAKLRIAIAIGAPTFGDSFIFNSCLLINANGELVATVEKTGITPAEATFFAQGNQRPVVDFVGQHCTAILCREANDVVELKKQIAPQSVDLIFWPGIMRPDPEKSDQPEHHIRDAAELARHTGAYVIQSNWPNSLNYPEESKESGHGVVISPQGETMFRLPKAQPGTGIFNLGESRYDWIPE